MFKARFYCLITGFIFTLVFISCEKLGPPFPADDMVLDGPIEGLTYDQLARFLKGDIAFNQQIFSADNGLGPVFVATSCGSCHAGDGKGHPFSTLTRFGQTDSTGNLFLHLGGPQLQNHALPGYQPEQIPEGATSSRFTPPANTGLGFLELVSDEDIIAMANQNINHPDGVRGHPNWREIPSYIVPDENSISQNGKYICRFGKKASTYNLLHQTVSAYNQDIGITSAFDLNDVYSSLDIDPEISSQEVNDVVFYLQTLKAPVQRNQDDATVLYGQQVFVETGCESCHKQTLTTGYSPIESLSYKEFYPYTDLLVHDMGSGLDDGYTEGNALTSEWRTPPLWGLGLSPDSQGGEFFLLHDGRAHSIEDAILMHGGEAEVSKSNFVQLSPSDKTALLVFLKSL